MHPEQTNINDYECIRVTIASPNLIRSWSHGEVTKAETVNYRSLKPERDGLFCARIFGPITDWECLCGKYKRQRFKGAICDRCGVEVTRKVVRRERMGHITLACPVSHIWFLRGVPSRIGYLLDVPIKELEKVLYFEVYIVIDPGDTPLLVKEILSEDMYLDCRAEYGNSFRAQMGAEAIRELLRRVDAEAISKNMRYVAGKDISSQRLVKVSKRLKIAEAFQNSSNRPEWMILDVLPVLPPDLRPLVALEGGRFAASDLNDLYRRIINRNNRLKRLLELRAPEVIMRNEKRMLQEAVDSLFETGKRGRSPRGAPARQLKSLSDALKGKQGRFRQNLLGKRVDYSGRSVIVVGPDLKLHQCGIPKMMALELFKPFVFNRLEYKGYATTIRQSKEMVDQCVPEVWDVLDEVVENHPVLLNRAPTLHRLGIQAFQPVLVEGKAIRLHPLVCTAFNADFDGDQMAVHIPLSPMAQIEARVLMMSTQNILNPANGRPSVVPSQDIVLGSYYLTNKRVNCNGNGMVFNSVEEVLFAHDANAVDTHTIIKMRFSGEIIDLEAWHHMDPKRHFEQDVFDCPSHIIYNDFITTSVGRVIFNAAMPSDLPFINGLLKKDGLLSLVKRSFKLNGHDVTVELLDAMKDIGFLWAMKAGVSVGIDDLIVPSTKSQLIESANKEVRSIEHEYHHEGKLDAATRYNRIIEVWSRTAESVAVDMMKELEKFNTTSKFLNSIYIMADSGARGSKAQIRQVSGMRGLMAKPSGDIIETPITANFKEGLSVLQYFTSTHGARKGLADTALKTADSGYLTRKLVDVAQDVIINEFDCGTDNTIEVKAIVNSDGTMRSRLRDRIVGRVIFEDIVDPRSKKVLAQSGTLLTEEMALSIEKSDIISVNVRSVLSCGAQRGVCAMCYGLNLATGRLVDIGEAVGVIAAQSIGEPGTQLTMRTFHVGGAASRTSEKSTHRAQMNGIVRLDSIRYVRNKKSEMIALSRSGNILVTDTRGRIREIYKVAPGMIIRAKDGETCEPKTLLSEWDPYNDCLIAEIGGLVVFKDFELNFSYREEKDQITGRFRKCIIDPIDDSLHPRIHIKGSYNRTLQRYNIPTGAYIEVEDGQRIHQGEILARTPKQLAKTSDITGGLPRVTELFEGRSPKDPAIASEISGIVKYGNRVRGSQKITVENRYGEVYEYLISRGKNILVQDGDEIEMGDKITEGATSLETILGTQGEAALYSYLLNEVQEVYRAQGVTINDKHIETIIRQMLRWIKITYVGDSDFIMGERVDKRRYKAINNVIEDSDGDPALCEGHLLGITKAALTSESFISAASFQETTRVLTEAAIEGRIDHLRGLKENVILGRLIPAGTGISHYRDIRIEEGQYPDNLDGNMSDTSDDDYKHMVQQVDDSNKIGKIE